jgi:hypothetical protein
MLHTSINKLDHTGFIQCYVYPFSFLKDHHVLIYEGVSSNLSRLCVYVYLSLKRGVVPEQTPIINCFMDRLSYI